MCLCDRGAGAQLYGHWEIDARTQPGTGWSSALLLWPKVAVRGAHPEIDIAEVPDGDRAVAWSTVHFGADGKLSAHLSGNFSRWNVYGLDWGPDHLTITIDGRTVLSTTNRSVIPHTPMFLAAQLDEGPVPQWIPAPTTSTPAKVRLQLNWVKEWSKPFRS